MSALRVCLTDAAGNLRPDLGQPKAVFEPTGDGDAVTNRDAVTFRVPTERVIVFGYAVRHGGLVLARGALDVARILEPDDVPATFAPASVLLNGR